MQDTTTTRSPALPAFPPGRRRRQPATGPERDRRDQFGKTWSQAGAEVKQRLAGARQ